MKSIRYMLGGKPRNLDDCLDFSCKTPPLKISLELVTDKYLTELYFLKYFSGLYQWQFPDVMVEFEKNYGCCLFNDDKEHQELDIDRSNQRLEKDLKRIEELNLEVKGKEKRFDYSMIYENRGE